MVPQAEERQCTDHGGYFDWASWSACGAGQTCIGDRCGTASPAPCTYNSVTYNVGDSRCDGSVKYTCISGTGGVAWDTGTQCTGATPQCQQSGQQASCVACPETCATHGYACGSWSFCGQPVSCGTCSQGTCNATGQCQQGCVPTCSNLGVTQCSGNTVQTCQAGSTGCLGWATTQTCSGATPYCALLGTLASCVQCTSSSQCDDG